MTRLARIEGAVKQLWQLLGPENWPSKIYLLRLAQVVRAQTLPQMNKIIKKAISMLAKTFLSQVTINYHGVQVIMIANKKTESTLILTRSKSSTSMMGY